MKHTSVAQTIGLTSHWEANRSSQEGFTLVEMLVASLVFTIAIVALMSMVLFALAARYSSRIDSAALKLSQQKLEELKSYPMEHRALQVSGNSLDASGNIDFDAAADPQATVSNQLLLNAARNSKITFETRWNVTNSTSRKIITVATRRIGSATPGFPVNLKVILAP